MEFVCPDPSATVRAANMRAILDAFALVPSAGERLIEKHRLYAADLNPDNWVRVQRCLDVLREIQSNVGASVLRTIGTRIVANAAFPPEFRSLESVLLAIDAIYHLNHRGDVGHYKPEKRTDGTIVVTCQTPYPRDFERGLVEGICENKVAGGRKASVEYVEGAPGAATTCTLTIRVR